MFQVNQAIEANIVRPELPEEADRVEQLLVRRVDSKTKNTIGDGGSTAL